MDGQAQVPIHLHRASDSAHIQLSEGTRILSHTLPMLLATQDPTVCFNPYGAQFGLIYVKHYFSVSLSTLKIPEILF